MGMARTIPVSGRYKARTRPQLLTTGSDSHTVRPPTVPQGIPSAVQEHVQYPSIWGHGVQVIVHPPKWYWLPTDEILDTPEILDTSGANDENPPEPEP
jgi:hypothetical protein